MTTPLDGTAGVEESTQAIRSTALAPMPMHGFALAPTTFDEAWRMAQIIAKTEFAPRDMRGKPETIIAALAMGNEVGLSPMQSLQSIAVINGRPSLWGDGMLGVVRRDKSFVKLVETIEGAIADGTMTAHAVLHRKNADGEVVETPGEFSIEDAKIAKLWDKDSPWRTYPKRMLKMRARAFALRDGASDLLRGMQSAEEQLDVVGEPARAVVASAIVEEIVPVTEEAADRVVELKKQLKWSDAKMEVELKTAGFDAAKVLEKMEAEAARVKPRRATRQEDKPYALDTLVEPNPVQQPTTGRATIAVARGQVVSFFLPNQERPFYTSGGGEEAVPVPEGFTLADVRQVLASPILPAKITKATNGALFASLADIGVESKEARLAFALDHDVEVTSYSKLTEADGLKLIDAAKKVLSDAQIAAAIEDGRPVNKADAPCAACETGPGEPHFANCPEAQPEQGSLL